MFLPAEASFSALPPSETRNLFLFAAYSIPPAEYLCNSPDDVRLAFRSIHNPTNRDELLPLWILTFWDEVASLINSHNRWARSNLWVARLRESRQEVEAAHPALNHLDVLGWGSHMSLYGLRGKTNLSLAQFLSDDRIDGGAIDLMAHFLSSSPTLPARVLVFDLRLSDFLSKVDFRDALHHTSPPHIRDLEDKLFWADVFYFHSSYEKNDHWIVFKVDALRKEVTYGMFLCRPSVLLNCNTSVADSMGGPIPEPQAFVTALLRWLIALYRQEFTFLGRKLPVCSQGDSKSSGFFAMNAISRDVYGVDLLTHGDIRKNRPTWFNYLCEATIQQVISPSFSKIDGGVDGRQYTGRPSGGHGRRSYSPRG